MSPSVFKGWHVDHSNGIDPVLQFKDFEPKKWAEDDVDVKLLYCGLCGSDATAASGDFGPIALPTVCGHELIGEVTRAGSKSGLKVGTMVGIGPIADSCGECEQCKNNAEQFCPKITMTWSVNQFWHKGESDGMHCSGGFAKYFRGPGRFAIPLPKGLDPAAAAPLLCAGLTVYSPMKFYGIGPGKKVGVLGIGGLGHIAVQLAKAMGAQVTAISRGDSKKADAMALGASKYIATGNNLAEDFKGHEGSLDMILCTINPPSLDPDQYLGLLKPRSLFILMGAVKDGMKLDSLRMLFSATGVTGSAIGSRQELIDLLEFSAKHNIKPWIQTWDMDDINGAMDAYNAGKAKFRYVLVNKDNGGSMEVN